MEENKLLEPTNTESDVSEESKPTFLGNKVIKICKIFIRLVRDGECTDEDIAETLALAEPRRFGYFRETDYVNVDEAMDILNLGYNRNLFYTLVKQYGIEIKTFKNVRIGYLRNDIERLAYTLKQNRPEVLKMKKKRKPKKPRVQKEVILD